jgi:hypothetical protein
MPVWRKSAVLQLSVRLILLKWKNEKTIEDGTIAFVVVLEAVVFAVNLMHAIASEIEQKSVITFLPSRIAIP